MKKFVLAVFLLFLISRSTVFAQQSLNSEELAKRISKLNDNFTAITINLSESMIVELNRTTEPRFLLSMKSINDFAQKYSDLLLYESKLILMYPYLSESVKLYFSGRLRDNLKQKRKKVRWFMETFSNHESKIMDGEILETTAKMREQVEEGQILIDQLINYYSAEYQSYQQDAR